MKTYEAIRYDVADGIATITLNRPDQLNSYTGRMQDELIDVFDRIDADDAVRAVVVTGAGRAFCAGADLSPGEATFDLGNRPDQAAASSPVHPDGSIDWAHEAVRDGGGLLTLRIFDCLKPVIAAINGPAVGIGLSMTLAMDARLASDKARFGLVFTRRGIAPDGASSWFLQRIAGLPQALEWCLSGRVFAAEEALRGGLVRSLHAPEDLLPAAYGLAREIADNAAPVSVALTRQMLWQAAGFDHPMEAHKIDSRVIYARGRSADAKEGVMSFLEKRPPRFPDRVSKDLPEFFPWWKRRFYS